MGPAGRDDDHNAMTGSPASPDATTPDAPPPRRARSRRQQRQSRAPSLAARDPHTAVNLEAQAAANTRTHLTGLAPVLTLEEQRALASRLVRKYSGLALDGKDERGKPLTANALKNYATAYGICSDKLVILQGKPTQVVQHAEAEDQRDAVLELARRLAANV